MTKKNNQSRKRDVTKLGGALYFGREDHPKGVKSKKPRTRTKEEGVRWEQKGLNPEKKRTLQSTNHE